jgi:diguanylate cyclase (GGDEF)-like protein
LAGWAKVLIVVNPTFQDVLVVDDDPSVRASLSQMLASAGFRVRTASDGAAALEAMRHECPYFVITDWLMQPMDGIDFCRAIRRRKLPHYVYVVLLTGRSQSDDIIAGLNAGADDFVTKPVSKGELVARLQAGARVLELESQLSQLARCDTLTGLLNRRTFHQLLEKEWNRAIRYHHPLSAVMMDLDRFKSINDTYGHMAGDAVLRDVAGMIVQRCRCPDYACRWGGEEFCLLLPDTDESGARIWAQRCCAAIAEARFTVGTKKLSITASFGVAQWQEGVESAERLLDLADRALYAAKRAGGERVVCHSSIAAGETVLAGSETE